MIRMENVSKRYGHRIALSEVSGVVRPGEITLLLGVNGAGKSTLLRCVLGIIDFEGGLTVGGLDPRRDGCAVRSLVGYMPQSGGLHPDLTVEETVRLYAGIRGASQTRGAALLEEAGLLSYLQTRVGELSGGLRQRLGFALALLTDPTILILDEPSASLDTASRTWLASRLRELAAQGRTVLISTHAGQELLDIADRHIVLEDGHVIDSCATARGCVQHGASAVDRIEPRRGTARPLIVKEIKDAVSNRWLIGYAALLATLGLTAAATGIETTAGLGLQAFGRTTATLMNLCLMVAPLVAVIMGASAIAGEQERGTLEHLLAQPLTRSQLLFAKHVGLLLSLTAATVAGFLPAGALIVRDAGPSVMTHYALFPVLATLATASMLAVGLLISVTSRSAVQAQAIALFAWFGFVLLYDLVLLGSLAIGTMPVEMLAAALLGNPVDAARVLGVLALEPDLYLLGPAGAFLTSRFGHWGTASLLSGAVVVWAIVPLLVANQAFRLRPQRFVASAFRRKTAAGARLSPRGGSQNGTDSLEQHVEVRIS
jgi:ABC-2 type transport system ATP-binding protein